MHPSDTPHPPAAYVRLTAVAVDDATREALSARLMADGLQPGSWQRRSSPHGEIATLILTATAIDDTTRAALLAIAVQHGCDLAVTRQPPPAGGRRLVAMDMDSTLIRIEVIDELARLAGVGEQVAAITRAAMAGEMDYDESLRRRVALLAGLESGGLHRIAESLPLSPGAEALVAGLRARGIRTALLSGGFDLPAMALQKQLGIDFAASNTLEVIDGKLSGRVLGRIVNGTVKARLVSEMADAAGLTLDQVCTIGDGANDIPMLQLAGLGLAFHGKSRLLAAADGALNGPLDRALALIDDGAREAT